MKDLSLRESFTLGAMVLVIVFLGFFPQPVINTARPAIIKTLNGSEQLFYKKTLQGDQVLSDENIRFYKTKKLKKYSR